MQKAELQTRINMGCNILRILQGSDVDLAKNIALAGGIVRDHALLTRWDIPATGSGDLDFLMVGVVLGIDTLAEELQQALKDCGYDVEYQSIDGHPEYVLNDRLEAVIQLKVDGIDCDFLVYQDKYQTMEDAIDTFDIDLNKFWIEDPWTGSRAPYVKFDWTNPEFTIRGLVQEEVEDILKLVGDVEPLSPYYQRIQRIHKLWLAVRAAVSTNNPYANIRE